MSRNHSSRLSSVNDNNNNNEYSAYNLELSGATVYEVINGLMSRPDWQEAIKMPVNQLPGGSANALACCTAHLSKEMFQDLSLEKFASSMAFYYSKAEQVPLDLIAIQLCNREIVHSFLTVEWAFIADVDLESEKYRYLGGMRFTVGAILRILSEQLTTILGSSVLSL